MSIRLGMLREHLSCCTEIQRRSTVDPEALSPMHAFLRAVRFMTIRFALKAIREEAIVALTL